MWYLFFLPFALAYLLYIWLNTDAFIEYYEFFRFDGRWLVVDQFIDSKSAGSPLSFIEYVSQFYSDKFFGRLVVCPICMSTWLGIIGGALVFPATWYFCGLLSAVSYVAALPFFTLAAYKFIK